MTRKSTKTTKKTRVKATATTVPQSREQAQSWIKELGDTQRKLGVVTAEMNDQLAEITDSYKPQINELTDKTKELQKGIQTWCEAHRDELTDSKTKTANLVTGEVSWRQRPPSVSLRGIPSIIENLHTLGLERFIRVKEEPNKDAMLNEPEVASSVAGVTINTGVEDFVIKPFEQEVTG